MAVRFEDLPNDRRHLPGPYGSHRLRRNCAAIFIKGFRNLSGDFGRMYAVGKKTTAVLIYTSDCTDQTLRGIPRD